MISSRTKPSALIVGVYCGKTATLKRKSITVKRKTNLNTAIVNNSSSFEKQHKQDNQYGKPEATKPQPKSQRKAQPKSQPKSQRK